MKAFLTLLCLSLASLSGACFSSREVASTRTFVPLLSKLPGESLPYSISVLNLSVSPHLEGDRIAARVSESEIEYYAGYRWAGPIDLIASQEIRSYFRYVFQAVFDEETPAQADFQLSGKIEFFEEWDLPDGWYGYVGLNLNLRNASSGELIWSGFLQSRKKASAKNPPAVVNALREAFVDVLDQATKDWKEVLQSPE